MGMVVETRADGTKISRIPPFSGATIINPTLKPRQDASTHSLGELAHHLEIAVKSAGFFNLSYYEVDGGFAIVTPLESIDESGIPLPDQSRWQIDGNVTTIKSWLNALATGNRQTCRVISLVVTDRNLSFDNLYMPISDLQPWRDNGMLRLTADQEARKLTVNHRTYALIYIFEISEKKGKNGQIERTGTQVGLKISPELHLTRSGVSKNL